MKNSIGYISCFVLFCLFVCCNKLLDTRETWCSGISRGNQWCACKEDSTSMRDIPHGRSVIGWWNRNGERDQTKRSCFFLLGPLSSLGRILTLSPLRFMCWHFVNFLFVFSFVCVLFCSWKTPNSILGTVIYSLWLSYGFLMTTIFTPQTRSG